MTPTAAMFSELLGSSSSVKQPQTGSPTTSEKKKLKGFFQSPLRRNKSSKNDKSKSAADLSHVGTGFGSSAFGSPDFGAAPSAPSLEEVHVHMAAEASRRVEDERMRRLRLQEEQDLAYAIALSKAEAASLTQK